MFLTNKFEKIFGITIRFVIDGGAGDV